MFDSGIQVDIQALAHAVELTRQGAIDSLRFAKGDLFMAFQVTYNLTSSSALGFILNINLLLLVFFLIAFVDDFCLFLTYHLLFLLCSSFL